MKKKLYLCKLAAALLAGSVMLLAGCGGNTRIRIGAAGLGGVYQSFAASYAQLLSEADEDTRYETRTTAGSAANLRLLSENYVQLAIAQADLAHDAYYGTGSFADSEYQGYSAVAALYTENCQIVVLDDSDIAAVSDLMGKTVSIGEAESGTEQNALEILDANGLSDTLVNEVNLNYTEAAKQLSDGEIDAFFCTSGVQTTMIEELAGQCDIRLLSLDDACVQKLTALRKTYREVTIPAGTYTGQDEDVTTVGVQALLLANDKLSEARVQEMTELLFEKQDEIQYSTSVDFVLTPESAVEGVTVPFHAGAAAYYEENGIQTETD